MCAHHPKAGQNTKQVLELLELGNTTVAFASLNPKLLLLKKIPVSLKFKPKLIYDEKLKKKEWTNKNKRKEKEIER